MWIDAQPTSGPPKRSTLMTMVDVIERVTGLDLDGDGTVGGDVLAEVNWFINSYLCSSFLEFLTSLYTLRKMILI